MHRFDFVARAIGHRCCLWLGWGWVGVWMGKRSSPPIYLSRSQWAVSNKNLLNEKTGLSSLTGLDLVSNQDGTRDTYWKPLFSQSQIHHRRSRTVSFSQSQVVCQKWSWSTSLSWLLVWLNTLSQTTMLVYRWRNILYKIVTRVICWVSNS
jgi:hypothetical protein